MESPGSYRPLPKPRKSLANKLNGCRPDAPPLPPRVPTALLPSPVMQNGESTANYALPNGQAVTPNCLSKELDFPINVACNAEKSLYPVKIKAMDSYIGPIFERLAVLDSNSKTNSCISTESMVNGENVCFSGWVKLLSSYTKKEGDRRRCWAVIRANQLSFMENDETELPFLGPFDLYKCVFTGRSPANPTDINLLLRGSQFLKVMPEENVDFWLVFFAKCHCPQSETLQNSLKRADIAGKLWVRQGVSGTWTEGWASVSNRVLYYWIQGFDAIFEADVRKIILIKRDMPIADYCNQIENSGTGPILIARSGSSLCLQAENDQATDLWFSFLDSELRKSGKTLEENRLTDDDVPVIVDKCLKLVSTFGLNQPGIYRKNGSASEARDLLREFRSDPYNVQLRSITDESINAVADNLRSFFRQLDSPLIPVQIHDKLYKISSESNEEIRMQHYRKIILSLPKVYFSTLKKLLAHLQQITAHSDKNLASVDNICKVFGPTIFSVDKVDELVSIETYAKTSIQIHVMKELLINFDEIFQISPEEIKAKFKLDEMQDRKQNPKAARAEGFLTPIHFFEKDNKCFNVKSELTASQVVTYKKEKLPCEPLRDSLALFEVVKNGQLQRRICDDETLTSIVLDRWLDWDMHSDCFLLLKKDKFPFQPQNIRPFADDVKIAEPGSRSFRTVHLKVESGTRVVMYSKNMKQQSEWIVDEMLWFVGCESERKPPYQHALTFFLTSKQKCKYKAKMPGYCVAFKDEVQQTQWLNSVIICKQEYLPTPLIQI